MPGACHVTCGGTQAMQSDIEYYKGHLRHLQTLNDCLRKDLDDLRRRNATLKWKKCDLEREIVRLNSTADCLRQRVRATRGGRTRRV